MGRPGAGGARPSLDASLTPAQAPRRVFSALSTTWATSLMRTGAVLRQATIRLR